MRKITKHEFRIDKFYKTKDKSRLPTQYIKYSLANPQLENLADYPRSAFIWGGSC